MKKIKRILENVKDIVEKIETLEGKRVEFGGWLHSIRHHRNVIFYDIRYLNHIIQCLVAKEEKIPLESFLKVVGVIQKREEGNENKLLKGGNFEVEVSAVKVVSRSSRLPFNCKTLTNEISYRDSLRFRSFFLRRKDSMDKIIKRMNFIDELRAYCKKADIQEVLTPILSNPTTEGAREFVVPSRLHKNEKYYALPQSPQQFKQLLISAGIHSYFQVAPCFRDEDIRADRYSGEFYQLDMEFALVDEKAIMSFIQNMLLEVFKKIGVEDDINVQTTPYREAIRRFSSDKPDLRYPFEFEQLFIEGVFYCKYLKTNAEAYYAQLKKQVKNVFIMDKNGNTKGAKIPSEFAEHFKHQEQLVGCIAFSEEAVLSESKQLLEIIKEHSKPSFPHSLVWVVDFPLFEFDENGKMKFCHSPFCMPKHFDKTNPLKSVALQYDLVLNGKEIGGGSIRNHKIKLLKEIIREQGNLNEYRGFIRNLRSVPPHGGFALGIERALMALFKEERISNFYAFPFDQQRTNLTIKTPLRLAKDFDIKSS